MSKFAKTATAIVRSAVQTVSQSQPDTVTAEGGAGFTRDPKSELFLLAVSNMVGEKTFYEGGKGRDERYESLIRTVVAADPGWVARFVPYLRNTMNMRSASLVMAAEYVRAGGPGGRAVVAAALVRADEPAELLGYWIGHYGKHLPQPLKRGLADAARRLYNERNALKYDSAGAAVRFADVIELSHPKPTAEWQGKLFAYLIAKRHNRENISLDGLPTIASHDVTADLSQEELRALIASDEETLAAGGWTWEALSTKYGKLDAAFWEAMIPNMGIFALVRNLRNFDDTKVGHDARAKVVAKMSDPEVIAKSRMFPLRFYSAWKNTGSMNWGGALETAIGHSLKNVPSLKGRTLILVDISGSMDSALSDKSKALRYEVAGLFGGALALRAEHADLFAFETNAHAVNHRGYESVIRLMEAISQAGPHGGTNTWQSVHATYGGHDRIVIITDEQAHAGYSALPDVPVYTFNVAGYKAAHMPSGGKRYAFGGLTDAGFLMLDLLERGKEADWPF